MAEVYGIKPKKFTKEWWPYFWMYYKWHTIATVAVVFAVLFTVVQCVTNTDYDLSATYTGSRALSDESAEKIGADMAQWIDDINEDGQKLVHFQTYTFMGTPGAEEYDSAMKTKLDLELYNEQSYIFIADKEELEIMLNNGYYSEVYASVDAWVQEPVADELLYKKEDGNAYAVSLKNSAYLRSNGYKMEDMYILLKNCYQDGRYEEKAFAESKKIANELLKE